MSKRLHPCVRCTPDSGGKFSRRGLTRHADRLCSWCRREGAKVVDGKVVGPPLGGISYAGRGA